MADEQSEKTWELLDLIKTEKAHRMGSEWWSSVRDYLNDHKIEVLMRPSENPGVYGHPGAGVKQLEIQERFFSRKYRGIFLAGGNRSGKSRTLWHMCGLKHIRDHAKNGEQYWMIAPTFQKLVQDVHEWLWESLPRSMFGDRVFTKSNGFGTNPNLELFLPDGRGSVRVVFKSEDQDLQLFESSSVNGVIWTEAEKEGLFDALWPRLVDTNGWMLIDYLPNQGWHYFRLKEHTNPKWHHEVMSMEDNKHNLPHGAIEEFMQENPDPDVIALRVHGRYKIAEGIVYKQFDIDRHVIKPFDIPSSWTRFRALDHGYDHPTAVLWGAMSPNQTLYIYREFFVRLMTVGEICNRINELSRGEQYEVTIADPAIFSNTGSDAGPLSEQYRRGGVDVVPGVRSSSVGEHGLIDTVRYWLQDDRIKIFGPPKTGPCLNTIREHLTWRYKRKADGGVLGNEQFEDKDNHTCDALKYLIAYGPRNSGSQRGVPMFSVSDNISVHVGS